MILIPILLDCLALAAIGWLLMMLGFSSESSRGRPLSWQDFLMLFGFWLLPMLLLIGSYCVSLGRAHWSFQANCWLVVALVALLSMLMVWLLANSHG